MGEKNMRTVIFIMLALVVRYFWSAICLILSLFLFYFLMRGFLLEVCGEIAKLFQ